MNHQGLPNKLKRAFFLDILLRQVYLYFQFGLPMLYSTRVTRVFKQADMEIENMGLEMPAQTNVNDQILPGSTVKYTWELFIDSLIREYTIMNIISVLLFS